MVDDILKYKRLDGVDAALSALAEGVFGGGQQRTKISPGSTPTLLIWGREDRILPVAHTANVKGARVEILEGAGHMAQMEKAAQVNTLIKARITANQ
jgi:pyruvate dehydrogenase E2 component (dihydrolipoamide acetyltransferase)